MIPIAPGTFKSDTERRLDALEKKLDRVLKALEGQLKDRQEAPRDEPAAKSP
jgi:hypothetical protein